MKRFLYIFIILPAFSFGQSVEPPVFSHETGFYTDDFELTLSHPDSSVTILYTLDGSFPSADHTEGRVWSYKKSYPAYPKDDFGELIQDTLFTRVYGAPILIKNRENEQDRFADIASSFYINNQYRKAVQSDSVHVFKGTPVRAVAYKDGEYSEVITRNYFVTEKGEKRYSLPVMCLTVDPDGLFDYEKGWNVPGKQFDDWRREGPDKEPHLWSPGNYHERGKETELEINFTYLVNGEEKLNHGAGLRANGNSSRIYPNRSLRLYAKKGYGPKNFEYPFFSGHSGSSFKRLILRNGGQDTEETLMRDGLMHRVSRKLNFDIQEYQPVILFINGEYWGIYNLRERYDKKYFERKYGIEEEDLDFIKSGEVKEGDDTDFKEMLDFLRNHSLSDPTNYQRITEWIDIDNFIDYYIAQIFAGNVDWPQSNTEYWRKRTAFDPSAPYGQDGRWRVVLKDLDYSVGKRWEGYSYKGKDLERVTTLSSSDTILNEATLIIRSLLENESFSRQFISRFTDILNSSFRSDVFLEELWEIQDVLSPEIEEFILRWNPIMESITPWFPVHSFLEWMKRMEEVTEFGKKRQRILYDHLQKRFKTGKLHEIRLNVSDPGAGYIRINTLDIKNGTVGVTKDEPYSWAGKYFENIPVTLTVEPFEEFGFRHWADHQGNVIDTARTLTFRLTGDEYLTAHFYEDPPPNTDIPDDDWLLIYPNPFSERFYIVTEEPDVLFSLYSIDGRLIRRENLRIPKISTDHLAPGVYVLHIEAGGKTEVRKIVKF